MNSQELETAIFSLQQLKHDYQSRYEHYLALAMEAKEHRERIELLLQDLCWRETDSSRPYLGESSLIAREPDPRLTDSPIRQTSKPDENSLSDVSVRNGQVSGITSPHDLSSGDEREELLTSSASSEAVSVTDDVDIDSSSVSTEVEQMSRFLEALSSAMSVLKTVFSSDSEKTLHTSYLHKILNQKLEQELGAELVELYLNEAITRGYIEQDDGDPHCYIVKPQSDIITDTSAKQKEDSSLDVVQDNQRLRNSNPNNQSRKLYKLPSSSKLKRTLLETVNGYIVKCSPKRFSIEDVVNYLYPEKQQLDWSKTTRIKVYQAIANALGRKAYLGKEWQRIEPGVYRPL